MLVKHAPVCIKLELVPVREEIPQYVTRVCDRLRQLFKFLFRNIEAEAFDWLNINLDELEMKAGTVSTDQGLNCAGANMEFHERKKTSIYSVYNMFIGIICNPICVSNQSFSYHCKYCDIFILENIENV